MAVSTWLSWSQVKWPHNTEKGSDLEQCGSQDHVLSQSTPQGDLEIHMPWNCEETGGVGGSGTGQVAVRAKVTRHHYRALGDTQMLPTQKKYRIMRFIRIPSKEFRRVFYAALDNRGMWPLSLIWNLVRTTSDMVPSYTSENWGERERFQGGQVLLENTIHPTITQWCRFKQWNSIKCRVF